MQHDARYDDVVGEVAAYLVERRDAAVAAGHRAERGVRRPRDRLRQDAEHNLDAARAPRRDRRRASTRRCSSARRARRSSVTCSTTRPDDTPTRAAPVTTRRSRPRCGRSTTARRSCGCTTSGRRCDAVRRLGHDARARRARADGVRHVTTHEGPVGAGARAARVLLGDHGPARGVRAPGGFARNHRKVRRQEELIWLDRPRLHAPALGARLAAQPARVRGGRHPVRARAARPARRVARPAPRALRARSRGGSTDPDERMLIHHEEFGDRLLGVLAGYLLYSGLVDRGPARGRRDREDHRPPARRGRPRDRRGHRRGAASSRRRRPRPGPRT